MARTLFGPGSPCEVSVVPKDGGGVDVKLIVPTYEGGAVFSLTAERDADGDWRVFIPWLAESANEPVLLDDGHECLNGIIYLGAPDVPCQRKVG